MTVAAGYGPYTSSAFATSIYPGPADEAAQTVSFVVTNTNNALFTVQPTASSSGTLTFTPTGAGGSATVNVSKNSTAVTTITVPDSNLPAQLLSAAPFSCPDAALFTLTGGNLAFTNAPDFEVPADANADKIYKSQTQSWTAPPPAMSVSQAINVVVEFTVGLNPTNSASMQLPQPVRIGNGFVFTFTQPGGVGGITYGAESSTTLLPGSWTPIADTGSGGTHTFSVPIGTNDRMFMRIVVTAP